MRRTPCRPGSEQLESRALLTTFYVTSPMGAGPGTLRAAINQSNQTPGSDVIEFRLSGGTRINLGNQALPALTGKVIIDGYTQPGAARNTSTDPAVNNAQLPVEITVGGGETSILTVNPRGGGTQIRGISFLNNGTGAPVGVLINQAELVTVDGNAFKAEGQSRLGAAVRIMGGSRNTIGGDVAVAPALQNVMRTYNTGVEIAGPSRHNAVVGNIIGGNVAESRSPLQTIGVWLRAAASNNTVVKNLLYKNITPVQNDGVGNVVEANVVVPR